MEPWVKDLLVGDEHGVQGRFQQSVGQVLGKVLDARGIEARFADFKCLGSAYKNTPDVVLPVETIQDEQDEPSMTLSVVLLERSPWWLFCLWLSPALCLVAREKDVYVKYNLLCFINTRRRSKSTHGGPDINLRTILTLQSPGSFVVLPQPPSHILHYSARISYPVVYGKCLTYSTSSAGLNLRKQCQNAHLFSPPTSHVVNQAISRVCRLGQTKIILIYEYLTDNTFQ